jgi:hypothetical protein
MESAQMERDHEQWQNPEKDTATIEGQSERGMDVEAEIVTRRCRGRGRIPVVLMSKYLKKEAATPASWCSF